MKEKRSLFDGLIVSLFKVVWKVFQHRLRPQRNDLWPELSVPLHLWKGERINFILQSSPSGNLDHNHQEDKYEKKNQDKYKKQQDKYQNHQEDQPGSKYCFAAGDMKVECEDDMVSFPFRIIIRKMKNNLSKIFLHVLTLLPSRTTHQPTDPAPPEKWRRVLTVKPTGWPTMEWRKILMEWQEVGDFWLGLVWHWAGGGCLTLSKSEAAEMGWRNPTGERWNRRRFRSWWI